MRIIMKSVQVFILVLFVAVYGYSQDTVNRKDAAGRKQGYWTKLDSSGKKLYEGHFHDNNPYGTFRYYYAGGTLKAVSVFSEDGKSTRTTTYFSSGKKNAEGSFMNEKKDGIWRFFSEYDEALVSEEPYKAGVKDGGVKTFFAGKGLAEIVTWKNGIREGLWEQYFDDGTLKLRSYYKNDLKDGAIIVYFPTGAAFNTGQYKEGLPDGTWKTYDFDGKLMYTDVYENGILVKTDKKPEPSPKPIPEKPDGE